MKYFSSKKKFNMFLLCIFVLQIILSGCRKVENETTGTLGETTEIQQDIMGETTETPIETTEDSFNNEFVDHKIMEITMLDVGQGLCVLVGMDNHYLLYDGGGRGTSSYVVSYLKNRNIDTLYYMIASHYDEDHISGLIGVMNTVDVQYAILPDYEVDTKIYNSFSNMLKEKEISYEYPIAGNHYIMDEIDIEILGPESFAMEKENNRSIAVKISYKDFRCIITGDGEKEEENYMLSLDRDISADLYIVGHHGSDSASCDEFLDAIRPRYAFISVGLDNDYGHPTNAVIEKLQKRNIQIYRTDLNGEISAYYDGQNVSVIYEKMISESSEDDLDSTMEYDTTQNVETNQIEYNEVTYVLNMNSKKFHKPDCESVNAIKEHNRMDTNRSREQVIADGYFPCKRCNP